MAPTVASWSGTVASEAKTSRVQPARSRRMRRYAALRETARKKRKLVARDVVTRVIEADTPAQESPVAEPGSRLENY
jgi:hypothetical protein